MVEVMPRSRPVARLLVIDSDDRLLLFDTQLAYTRVWLTPGGAVNSGETYEEGALRELWEETGLSDIALGPCVWTTKFRFRFKDIIYDQNERYFVVRIDSLELNKDNWEKTEQDEIQEYRWWNLNEIGDSNEQFRPGNLAALLKPILAGSYPEQPVAAPIEAGAITEPM